MASKPSRSREKQTAGQDLYLDFEHFLSFVFGKQRTHGLTNSLRDEGYGKWCEQLVVAMRRYVTANATRTDRIHRKALLELCDRAKIEVRHFRRPQDKAVFAVMTLSRLVFELLGEQPNNWNQRSVSHPNQWRLDSHRTVAYSQTPRQKLTAIMDATWRLTDRQDRAEELRNKIAEHPNDPDAVLAWVRDTYPELYLKLF